jgi:adhesin/invasin
MKSRRTRLSVTSLEERATPATSADLYASVSQTYATSVQLQQMASNFGMLANPFARPIVQSYFQNVYSQSINTMTLLAQFPGALPGPTANLVSGLASMDASIASSVASVLGFQLVAPAVAAPVPTTPALGPVSAARSVIAIAPTSIPTGGTTTVTLTARDANGRRETTGGSTVEFGVGVGSAQGTFSTVTDNGDGTYTATFTGTTAGTNTITGTIDGAAVTSTLPTVTVVSTTADLARSTIAVSPASVPTGGTSTVTLQAKDANGNALTAGGSTVTFALGSGTAQGTFGAVTDNHNGTYTATFTGSTAGTNTITATLGGQALTSTAPTITVVGTANATQSVVTASPTATTVGGTTTVTLAAKDASGNALTTGGSTVVFALGAGTGQGTFGPVTDNGNGTYTATLTGTTAGTNTITATLNGTAVTTTAPTITITAGAGPVDLAQSLVSLSPSSFAVGGTSTVTLTAKDANGVAATTGGSTVLFSLGAGTGQGTFSTVIDNGNGTYTATLTGTTAGANTVTATLGGQAVTSTAPSFTVTPAATITTADATKSTVAIAPSSVAIDGTATVTLTARDANGVALTSGGSDVAFAIGDGTGDGTFDEVTDNGNGTYTATFTGTTAGTNTITATLDGADVTTTAPTVTVVPPMADPAQSVIEVDIPAMQVGDTAEITLTANDASGTQLDAGGSTVVFSLGNGAGRGIFDDVIDNDDGTYTATFTATTAGTNTITATIDGQPITSTAPTITVVGPASLSRSLVSLAPTSIANGATTTVTLTARDANGNQVTTGGSTVDFSLGNGAGTGTFDDVTDNGDGTYTATFTATTAGTNTIRASLDDAAITSTAPTLTIT